MTDLYAVSLNRNLTPACPCLLAPEKMILHPPSRSRTHWSFQRNSSRSTTSHFNPCNSFTRRSPFPYPRRDLTFQVPMFTVVLALLNFRTALTNYMLSNSWLSACSVISWQSSLLRVGLFPILIVIHTLLAGSRGSAGSLFGQATSHLACPFLILSLQNRGWNTFNYMTWMV